MKPILGTFALLTVAFAHVGGCAQKVAGGGFNGGDAETPEQLYIETNEESNQAIEKYYDEMIKKYERMIKEASDDSAANRRFECDKEKAKFDMLIRLYGKLKVARATAAAQIQGHMAATPQRGILDGLEEMAHNNRQTHYGAPARKLAFQHRKEAHAAKTNSLMEIYAHLDQRFASLRYEFEEGMELIIDACIRNT